MKKSVIFVIILLLAIPMVYSESIHGISEEQIKVTADKVKTSSSEHYIYGMTGKEASIINNEITYYHKDHLGSNSLTTNSSGNKKEKNKYLPFGENINPSEERFTFTGKETDKSGLQYTGARYYDSDIGRFTTVDPIKSGMNHYVYVNNNPLKYVDPSGMLELNSVGECAIPTEVLTAMYSVVMETEYEKSHPRGVLIWGNYMEGSWLDFVPFFHSRKEEFFNLMAEKTFYDDEQIQGFYDILSSPGNIVLVEDYSEIVLFHERIHHVLTYTLDQEDLDTLMSAQEEFIGITTIKTNFLAENVGSSIIRGVVEGSWQELYAYMGAFEEYPEDNFLSDKIGFKEGVSNSFGQLFPEAYEIYETVLQTAKELDPGYSD